MKQLNKTAAKQLIGKTLSMNGETTQSFEICKFDSPSGLFLMKDISTNKFKIMDLGGINHLIKTDNKMKNHKPFITIG